MRVQEFVHVLQDNYLQRYLPEGGSAFKAVVSAEAGATDQLCTALRTVAEKQEAVCLVVSGCHNKLHMMDKLYFAVAGSINWHDEAIRFLKRHILGEYEPTVRNGAISLEAIASRTGCSPEQVKSRILVRLRQEVSDNVGYCSEFRLALMHLLLGRVAISGAALSPYSDLIEQWLCGDLASITALRPAYIFRKIQRSSARHILYSTICFLRQCGHPYVLLLLNIGRYMEIVKTSERGEGLYYSFGATLDLYELLRQFVDDMQELDGAMMLVLAPRAFLNDERRSLERYQALKMRLVSEIRIRNATNPLAPLAWVW